MSPNLRAAAIFTVAALVAWLATPLARRVALRIQLLDVPTGYKAHARATPYLGGAAILLGVVVAALVLSGPTPGLWLNHGWAVVACALVLWVVGTADDRATVPVTLRVGVEVGLAVALYYLGHGWQIFHVGVLDLALTIVWVVGIVNAFNLMDNMDGAAATAAGVSSLGAGALALLSDKTEWAPLCFAVAGACLGFLPYNLARPARIFMGDGGSLPLGIMVAALTMSVVRSDYLGPSGVVVGALLVALVILDTTLVSYSRTRGGRPVMSGGRDHLTHRIVERLGSPGAVAATLAVTQFVVCSIAIAVARAGLGWVLLAGGVCLVFGIVLIWQLEHRLAVRPRASRPPSVSEAADDPLSTAAGVRERSQLQVESPGKRVIAWRP
jgi:UDP-GlcNAc:undecaprenyl-phosphate GlcNAc-1-phosphate transferase